MCDNNRNRLIVYYNHLELYVLEQWTPKIIFDVIHLFVVVLRQFYS